ncbi:hypothetical protein MNEG_15566, partial [Monoraphidium neglectum]
MEDGQPKGWRRICSCFRRGKRGAAQEARVVMFPQHAQTLLHSRVGQQRYRGNSTRTTKYTLLSFLPKSLFEQYR